MNFNFYIFGNPDRLYSQYPNDYTASTIPQIVKEAQCRIGLIIHREMNLMHYIFIEDVGNNQTIGFCLIFNNAQLSKPISLITLFKTIVRNRLIETGTLFGYTDDWDMKFRIKNMSECVELHKRLKVFINKELEEKKSKYGIDALNTTYNGSKSLGHYNDYYVEDKTDGLSARGLFPPEYVRNAEIIALTNRYNTVAVHEEKGIESDYFHSAFNSLRKQHQKLSEDNKKLQEENIQLSRKKKQYHWIILLSIIATVCFIGLYFLNNNLSSIISNQESAINELQLTITEQNDSIVLLHDSLEKTKSALTFLAEKYPIHLSSIDMANTYKNGDFETEYGQFIHSNSTMYLQPRIKYTGIDVGKLIKLRVKLYMPDGSLSTGETSPSGFSFECSLRIYNGYNTKELTGWGNENKGYWKKGTYRIEVWYNDVCLKADDFTIY